MWCVVFVGLVAGVWGQLPCEYLSSVNGNIVAPDTKPLCLGKCPEGPLVSSRAIYISPGQTLYFGNFVMKTAQDEIQLLNHDGSTILHCYAPHNQCFAGTVPPDYPNAEKPPGLYLTGKSGGKPISPFDPWVAKSTILLDADSTLQSVSLVGVAEGEITGWRITTGAYSYTFTDRQQLIVGDVPAATILAHEDARVIADGPVVVRKASSGCAVPIFRPQTPTLVLIYSEVVAKDKCDFSGDAGAFTMTVEHDRCYKSPIGSPLFLKGAYFRADDTDITYYTSPACLKIDEKGDDQFGPICEKGWSRIKFSNAV
jgi:hypothetical protein